MSGPFFMFATFGEMTVKNIVDECHVQRWLPVLVARPKEPQGQTLIPCFNTRDHAMQFGFRNLSKKHLFGTLNLATPERAKLEAEWVAKRGWKIELFTHPRLIKNQYDFDVEIIETDAAPNILALQTKLGTTARVLAHTD